MKAKELRDILNAFIYRFGDMDIRLLDDYDFHDQKSYTEEIIEARCMVMPSGTSYLLLKKA